MKAKVRRILFWAIIATGIVLPWLSILLLALVSDTSPGAAFCELTADLPLYPLIVVFLAAWWTMPFVVFAFLWRRLATARWEPLRRNPLLILLGIPVALSPMGAAESQLAALYLLSFLVYAMVAVPSWGLRSPVSRIVFSLFGLLTIVAVSLFIYVLLVPLGTGKLQQHVATPFGVLAYMTGALMLGYLFAKPIDWLITRDEPLPEVADRPKPSAWLIGGNALTCGLGFVGSMLLYARLGGSAVTRHEVSLMIADQPTGLALFAVSVGALLGVGLYLAAFAVLRKRANRRANASITGVLAILPGLLLGIAPGLVGERAVLSALGSEYVRLYSDFSFASFDSVLISPDGSRIAAEMGGRLVIWDVASGNVLLDTRSETSDSWIAGNALAWSPDGNQVSVSASSGRIVIVDSHSGRRLSIFNPPDTWRPGTVVSGAVFTKEGTQLIAARSDGGIYAYELVDGKLEWARQSPVPTRNLAAVALSPDGHHLAIAGITGSDVNPMGGFVAELVLDTGELRYTVDDFDRLASELSFSPSGSRLVYAGIDSPPRVIDTDTGRPFPAVRHHCPLPAKPWGNSVFHAVFLGNSQTIAMACNDGVVEVCDAASGECSVLFKLQLQTIGGLTAHPDGRRLAVIERGGTVTLWDTQSVEPLQTYRLP